MYTRDNALSFDCPALFVVALLPGVSGNPARLEEFFVVLGAFLLAARAHPTLAVSL